MNERERATDTFRSISKEAVNNILDELDKIGDFARLNAHLVDKLDVQEVFKAINSYSKKIEAKYEPKVESRGWRFQFSDEKEVDPIKPETVLTLANRLEEERIEINSDINPTEAYKRYEIILSNGTKKFADSLTEVARIINYPYSNVSRHMRGKEISQMHDCVVIDRLPNSPFPRTARKEIEIYVDNELLAVCQHGYREASNITHIPATKIRDKLSCSDDGTYTAGKYTFKYGKEIV